MMKIFLIDSWVKVRYTTSVTPAENPQVTTGVEKGLKRDYTGRLIGNRWGASVVGDAYIGS